MGSGFKTFTAGSVLTASDVQNYLQDQAVMVFGGTAARSSAIGTANFEEGMLTYLTDVDKLQVYNGSSFVDVYPAAATNQGLTLINTTSFSAVSSQSVNDVFSATYDRYLLVVSQTKATSTGSMYLRLRVSGTDASGSDYKYHFSYGESTVSTYQGLASNADTGYRLTVDSSTTDIQSANVTIFNPFAAAKTSILGTAMNFAGTTAGGQTAGGHNLATSYTGFTIYNSAGTMTGSINLYGFNK